MNNKLNVAIQMDPLEDLSLKGDTTFVLGLEAQQRDFEVFHYTPNDLFYKEGKVLAYVKRLKLSQTDEQERFAYGETEIKNLSSFDIILMRQDPPFNLSYITATHLLEKVSKNTLVVNDPISVRNAPEKIFVTNFFDIMPKTIITRNINEIRNFRNEFHDIIIKPLYGNGGEGIFHINKDSDNFHSIIEMCFKQYKEQLVIQEYIPAVKNGDKRIILIDGEPVGAVNRIPPIGESRSNMHVGGKPKKTNLTKHDIKICKKISKDLRDKNLFFVGIDVIGQFITEINVTSPTGIREINRLNSINSEKVFWDKLEIKLSNHRS